MRIATPDQVLKESVIKSGKRYWNASSQAVIVDAGTMKLDIPLVVEGKCQYLEWRADVQGSQLEIDGIECVRITGCKLDQASGLSEDSKIAQAALGGWRTLVLRNFASAYLDGVNFGQATDLNNVHVGPGKRLHVRDCWFDNKSHYDASEGAPRWIGGGPIIDGVDEVLWDSNKGGDTDMRLPDVARCKYFAAYLSMFESRTSTPNVLTDVRTFSCANSTWANTPWGGGFVCRGTLPVVEVLTDNAISVPVIVEDKPGYPPILPKPQASGGPLLMPAWMRRVVGV